MSLFDKLKNKRSSLQEKKDDGIKKPTKKANKEVFDVTGKSAAKDAKKYASGEYPKIGGGERMTPKSKGPGASTGGTKIPSATVGGKSKGTTPVKVNITKPIKQSEISKQAKKFTKEINVKKIEKDADRLVRKAEKGNKKARKKIFKVLDKKFKKLSPADQEIEATKMADYQKKMGRKFNPKTGNFEGPDTKFQKSLSKIKDSKGKRITSGPVSVTAGPKIRKRVETIRDTRATKAGMPDPFKSKTKFSQKQFNKTIKSRGIKVPQVPLIPDPFGKGDTKGMMNVKDMGSKAFKKTQPKDVKLPKSFTDFSKKLKTLKTDVAKTASATPRTVTKKYKPSTPKTPSQLEVGGGGGAGSKPPGGTSGASTRTVKQSEVSKKAKEFTKKINQKKTTNTAQKMSTIKGDPLQGNVDYDTSTKSTPKPKKTNVFKRVNKATSGKGVTNSKGIGNKYRKNPELKKARINADRAASGMGGGKQPPKPPTAKGGTLGFPEPDKVPKRVVSKQTKALQSAQGKFAKSALGKGLRKNLPQVYKGVRSLGPAGRAFAKTGVIGGAATIGTAFLAKNLLKKAAIGGVGGGILGGAAASQKMSDKERIKKNLPAQFVKDKDGKEIKTVSKMNFNLSDYSKKTKKLKPRTATSLKGSADYAGKVKNIPAYGAKYTG